MTERIIRLEDVSLATLWGSENRNFEYIRKTFPILKLIARGDELKILGEPSQIKKLERILSRMVHHVQKRHTLTPLELESIVERSLSKIKVNKPEDSSVDSLVDEGLPPSSDVIVYGAEGRVIKARTPNQKKMVESLAVNDVLFAIGPAGTGKTYTAVALAVRALKNKEIKRIILTRPAVEAGENLGFLPGDLKDKVDPYLRPLYDALDDMIPQEKLKYFLENRTIEIAPLAFMRGRTLDNCFVILDEAQNATDMQLKMFLTRMGPKAKFIVTGDMTQVDLPKKSQSGLVTAVRILDSIEGIGMVYLTGVDVVRHKIVKRILEAYGDINK